MSDLRRGATLIRYHLQNADICASDRAELDALADYLDDRSRESVAAPERPGCVNAECPHNLPCPIHCSSCGGDLKDAPPCQRNPITGEGCHKWSDGLPKAAAA